MAFRIQDLMMDVRPGGWQMANPECTCQVTAKRDEERGREPRPGKGGPADNPACQGTILPSCECPPDRMESLAGGFALLREQLRRDLGQGA